MLHEFLTANRDELIRRCRLKVSQRDSPAATAPELAHGVPLFLSQLVEALRREESNLAPEAAAAAVESSLAAAVHGKELRDEGYTVDQVVHGYGDICQAVTELAKEKAAPVTVDEFHTFNRLLDNAIAAAVASYGHQQYAASIHPQGEQDWGGQMGTLADGQRRILDTALKALDALKVGNIGLMGATGTLLEDNLLKLRSLIDQSLPETRPSTKTAAPLRS